MKKMQIFEPAMCCQTGLCGVSVNPELLRISTVLMNLKKKNIIVERFNLNGAPMKFVTNKVVNEYISRKGPEGLPLVTVDGEIYIEGRYPTNEEFTEIFELPEELLDKPTKALKVKVISKKADDCGCKGGC